MNSLRDIFLWARLDPTEFARRFNAAYAAAWRENRKRIRHMKREAKHRAYAKNGLNGPRACERRARQWDAIETKRVARDARMVEFLAILTPEQRTRVLGVLAREPAPVTPQQWAALGAAA